MNVMVDICVVPMGVGVSVILAIRTGLAVFVDVALVVALVSFLGTVALSRAIELGDDR